MIVYVVPNRGIYGGIKVAYQFVDALRAAGAAACIATPDGRASQWFRSQAPVVAEDDALDLLAPDDVVVFSLPDDYDRLRTRESRLVFHCQGTDPAIDRIIADPDVIPLTCWAQATAYVQDTARRAPVEVGIAIGGAFRDRGGLRDPHAALHMPRRGQDTAMRLAAANPGLALTPLDGLDESEVAARMRRAGVFLATSQDEWIGLPALEAMASGCIVFSVPVLGGMEYLQDGVNCHVGDVAYLEARIAELFDDDRAGHWAAMRHAAIATGLRYRPAAQRPRIDALLDILGPAARRPLAHRRDPG